MKQAKGFSLWGVIVIMIITSVVSGITTGVIMLNSNAVNSKNETLNDEALQEFIGVYQMLLSKYYDNIDKEGMLNAAEEGMLNFLGDKYTTYLDNDEYKGIIDDLSGIYNGIGVTILGNVIQKVTDNSPASKAGLWAGDVIVKINGISVEGMASSQIGSLIKDDKTKEVTLEIERNGENKTFNLEKEDLVNPAIDYNIVEGTNIGYLAIEKFSENLGSQVKEALNYLENNGITSLIIDVRDDSGGYLTAAEDVASFFLEKGKTIYSLQSSSSMMTYSDKTDEKRTYPIIVLINGNSASASEILAAALKESYNATLLGNKSYGKGKVQQIAKLSNGSSVKYTSAKWLTPNGTCIDGIGIMPDYEVNITDESIDEQLNEAVKILSEG